MDAEPVTPLQQLAEERLSGRLRERVEALRREGKDWGQVAETISEESRLAIARSTLHRWAERAGWEINPTIDRAAAS